jgi:tol-pal system protein YbgF
VVARILAVLTVLVVLPGCATTELREGQERSRGELQELGRRVERLADELGAVGRDLGELRQGLTEVRRELAEALERERVRQQAGLDRVGGRLEAQERQLEELARKVSGVDTRVSELAARLGGVEDRLRAREGQSGSGVHGPRPPATVSATAEELFDRGLDRLRAGELGQAILDLEELVERYPSHPLGASARFWIGDAYFRARDYEHAVSQYTKAIEAAPGGPKTPEALLKVGLAHRALRREDLAREAWSQLVRDFPESEAAQRARRELARLPRPGG